LAKLSTRFSWAKVLNFAPQLLLLVILTVAAVVDPRIVALANLVDVLVQATPIALVALGAMVVLVSGGIDFSPAYGVSMCAVLIGATLLAGGSLLEAIAWGIGGGVIIGLFNGLVIGVLKIPPFVTTFAALTIVQGITLLLATETLIVQDPILRFLGSGSLGPVPVPILAVGFVAAFVGVLVRHTRFGLRSYAIGSNEESARLSGVPMVRQQVLIYVFSGVMTALAAVLLVGRVSIITPNLGGISLLLDAIAATVIGGTSIFGGRGTVGGTLTGAVIVSLVTNILRVLGVGPSSQEFFKGAIIIVALSAEAGFRALQSRLKSAEAR
jgi:ribose/xylose/arabinose/galactoside ABC-type transport system permease subunit